LKKGAVAEWNGSDIVQAEFKKTGFRLKNAFIQEPGPLFAPDGDIVLQADGTIFQHAKSWSLPATKYTEWMNNDAIQARTDQPIPSAHKA
jgi:hypothetical protein